MEHFEETAAWKDYRRATDWQRAMGFEEKFPLYVRFKEGDQWPPATRRTRNLPRPVFNMVEMFIRAKRASVLDQPVSMSCRPAAGGGVDAARAERGARDFTDYARQLWKRLGQEELNSALVDDAATVGTGVLHYYWDTSVQGTGSQPYVGEIRGEAIDPLSILFCDVRQRNVQKQDWVMIAQRLPLKEAQRLAEAGGMPATRARQLRADTAREVYDAAREYDGDKRVTVLTRYFRREGEVWFEKCTRYNVLVAARPLTPAGAPARMTLYPLAVLPWKLRKDCVYGIGEAEGLLPSQKALNYNMAMMLLSVQQTGWPKLLVKPNALQQPVTNEPGELLVDYWQGGGDGIRYLQAPTFSSLAVGLSEKVLSLSREISGVGQVTTGDIERTDLAAAAIIAMQNQARTPIREIQRRFWRTIEQVGSIWLQFFCCYCSTPRPVAAGLPVGGQTPDTRSFVGTDYAGVEYEMSVDVGASSEYSEVLSQATLDKMLDKGYLTIDQYVELSGPNVVPFRERFRQLRRDSAAAGATGSAAGGLAGMGRLTGGAANGPAGAGTGAVGALTGLAGARLPKP